VINDKAPSVVYGLDWQCQVTEVIDLGVPVRDTEDLARTPDGTLWIGDMGGNKFRRTAVQLYKRTIDGLVTGYRLDYPDGPHDAEALMISPLGQVVIVTKRRDGLSGIYTTALPKSPRTRLSRVGTLNVRPLRPLNTGSLVVTGAAVSPSGQQFALRTYTTAYEWDIPDGNIVHALRHDAPRAVQLAPTQQGEAISYSIDGNFLLATSEKLPAPLNAVSILRAPVYLPVLVTTTTSRHP
jgi:hypothetical protein